MYSRIKMLKRERGSDRAEQRRGIGREKKIIIGVKEVQTDWWNDERVQKERFSQSK